MSAENKAANLAVGEMADGVEEDEHAATNNSNGYLWRNTRVLGIILVYCAIGSQLSVVNKVAGWSLEPCTCAPPAP